MNQEKESPFLKKVLLKIAANSQSPAKALYKVFPARLGLQETVEEQGELKVSFHPDGFSMETKGLMVDTGTGLPPTDVDGMLAIALFLIETAEFKLAKYQATVFCHELEKLIATGSLTLNPDDDIPDHVFQMVMVNASAAAHDENQVPEGTTVQ